MYTGTTVCLLSLTTHAETSRCTTVHIMRCPVLYSVNVNLADEMFTSFAGSTDMSTYRSKCVRDPWIIGSKAVRRSIRPLPGWLLAERPIRLAEGSYG